MAFKKYILLFGVVLTFVLFLHLASAQVTVNYHVDKGVWKNGSLQETNLPVNGATVLAFVCGNKDCTSVTSTNHFYSFTAPSNSNLVAVKLPENIPSGSYGYALYLFKEGYIGWQQWNITYEGNGNTDGGTLYLSKEEKAFAPITDLSVYNKVGINKPIEINVSVGIDGNAVSAIENTEHVQNIPLNENVKTLVGLNIFDENGNLIYEGNTTLNIPYSGTKAFSFDFPGFNQTGEYNVNVSTQIVDGKIINPKKVSDSFEVQAIEKNKTNYSYSLLRNVSYSPAIPRVGNSINVSLMHLSNYVDNNGNVETFVDTALKAIITRDNVVYKTLNYTLSDGINPSLFSFNFYVNKTGDYSVKLIASPSPGMGNSSIGMNSTLSFTVNNLSGDVTPPAQVSDLRLISRTDDSLKWGWDNPNDSDFDHVVIHFNGKDYTTSGDSYEFTGLNDDTEYTINVTTVDSSGNENPSWSWDTQRTEQNNGGSNNGGGTYYGSDGVGINGVHVINLNSGVINSVNGTLNLNNISTPVQNNNDENDGSWFWIIIGLAAACLLVIVITILALLFKRF